MGFYATYEKQPARVHARQSISPKTHTPDRHLHISGSRYYSPELGRWPSRDPIEEAGGVNLYMWCLNDGIGIWDLLGMDAYFASGHLETLFELAAQEQAGIVTSYHGDIAKAVKDTNNSKDYGPVFVGKMKVHKLANNVDGAAAKQILGDTGDVYIYSHGYTAGLSPDGVAYLTPEHITTALEGRPGKKHSVKRVWALGCNFGNKGGGASKWAEILGIKVTGHINTGNVQLEGAYKLSFWGKAMEDLNSDVLAGFKKLRKDAEDGNITAKAFMDGWEKEFEKQKKRGCIKKAYWHIHDTTPTYATYPEGK